MREPAISVDERTTAKRVRRQRRSVRRLRRAAIVLAAIGVCVAVLVAGRAAFTHITREGPADARPEIVQSLGLLDAGNFSAARNHAIAATRADPGWGLAQAVLGRSYLALGEGVAAEGALTRAIDAGFDPHRAHQMLAHAYLLEGDPKRALDEARKSDPRFAGYALRVAAKAMAAQGDYPSAQDTLQIVLDTNPNDSLAWSDLGRIRYSAGDIGGAIGATTRALDLGRNNVEALTLRGELVRDQFGLLASIPWFEAALAHDAYYHPALIEYAATLGDIGRNADMLAATRRALAARPGSPQAFYLEAVLAARAGRYDLARTLLGRTGGKLDGLPGALLLGGMLDYRDGAYEQAIKQWRELVGHQPFNLAARRLLGAALSRSGDARGALDVLRPLAVRGDADTYALTLAGRNFERTGERDWAAKLLNRAAWTGMDGVTAFGSDDSLGTLAAATAGSPGDPAARIGYLKGLIDANDLSGALTQAQTLAADAPGAPQAQIAVGDVLMLIKRYDDAAAAYRHAADLRFDEATMLRTVDALDHAGRAAEATNVLALYASQNPQSVAAQRIVAHRQIAGGEWDAAVDTLENVRARIGNRDAALLSELGYAYVGAGDETTGLIYAKAAYRLSPMNPAAADSYGWALYQQGKDEPALQLLEKAASIAPGDATLRWHLAQAQADLGRNADAASNIRAALADPAFGERAPAQALLKTLG